MIKIELQKNHQWMLNFNREKDLYIPSGSPQIASWFPWRRKIVIFIKQYIGKVIKININ